ncbi:hypothetical protein PoB_003242100 [Plakobranchus ocellatus]|uniref:Uncharacterized protein n=1 Tax=Plakobranchus ocellatus TaxID=259542 RepID=A0AAV4AC24_9GAST|nr:hypothetical protein PoB_003242100 [Plakobranchus ocellatus]
MTEEGTRSEEMEVICRGLHPAEDGQSLQGCISGTVVSESALRSAGTPLLQVQAPPQATWPYGGPEKPEITLLWTGYKQKPKPIPKRK